MYQFTNPESYRGHPADALDEAACALDCLTLIFVGGQPPEMNESQCRGLSILMSLVKASIRNAEAEVTSMIQEPRAEGYCEGARFASDEYHRGHREGRRVVLRAIDHINPVAASKIADAVAAYSGGDDGEPPGTATAADAENEKPDAATPEPEAKTPPAANGTYPKVGNEASANKTVKEAQPKTKPSRRKAS